jgi:hypothetical protein
MKELLTEWKAYIEETKRIDISPESTITTRQLESVFKYFHLSRVRLDEDYDDPNTFTFTPRIPGMPMSGEDDFTKRVSLAPKINRAIYSLEGIKHKDLANKLIGKFHLYATNNQDGAARIVNLAEHKTRCKKALTYPGGVENPAKVPYFLTHEQIDGEIRWNVGGFALRKIIPAFYGEKICYNVEGRRRLECYQVAYSNSVKQLVTALDSEEQKTLIKDMFRYCVPDSNLTREHWALDPIKMHYIGRYSPSLDVIDITRGTEIYLNDIGVINKKDEFAIKPQI